MRAILSVSARLTFDPSSQRATERVIVNDANTLVGTLALWQATGTASWPEDQPRQVRVSVAVEGYRVRKDNTLGRMHSASTDPMGLPARERHMLITNLNRLLAGAGTPLLDADTGRPVPTGA